MKPVEAFWHEVLPDDEFMLRPRMSRIYYQGKYYDYPLKPFNALRNLGFIESVRCAASYAWARVHPPADQTTFEGWVAARFGWRLYKHFFKTYTEKVWGYPGSELQADWAAQRIKNLNLFNAVKNALFPKKGQREITTLIDQFEYPQLGPGMMWERCCDKVEAAGSKVMMRSVVTRVRCAEGRAVAVESLTDGALTEHAASAVIASRTSPSARPNLLAKYRSTLAGLIGWSPLSARIPSSLRTHGMARCSRSTVTPSAARIFRRRSCTSFGVGANNPSALPFE